MINQIEKIKKHSVLLVSEEELSKKLARGKPLKIKLGADPTAPDLHLGHSVVLQKMRDFQELGHDVIFVIGDFTSLIGDPTGKSKTRPPLSPEEIKKNATTYFEQVFKILDKEKTKISYNSEWLGKLNFAEITKLCAKTTVSQILEREDFKNRYTNQISIGLHELLYPIMQGYDSVALEADVELGGTDQTFNLIFGRHLQEQFGQEAQIVLTSPILEGLDGKQKMSKSLKNYVGLTDEPKNMFGKIMSICDESVPNYFRLVLRKSEEDLSLISQMHPMAAKKQLAFDIVSKFHDLDAAESAKKAFEDVFQKNNYENVEQTLVEIESSSIWISDLLRQLKIAASSSEAKRLVESSSVVLKDVKLNDFKMMVEAPFEGILRVGKKVFNLKIQTKK